MGNPDAEPSVHGASELADNPGRAGLVAAELVRAQYRNIPTAVGVNLIISALLCVALRQTVSLERLGWWLAAICTVAGVRYLLWRRFNRSSITEAAARRWRNIATLGSGINGSVWGLGG